MRMGVRLARRDRPTRERMAKPMTAPQRSLQANSRGIAVLITAVVVGFLLLVQAGSAGGGGGDDEKTAPAPTTTEAQATTTTDADGGTEGTTTTEGENGEGEEPDGEDPETGDAQVAVLNGKGTPGLAGETMQKITDAGYAEGFVGNVSGGADTTGIYYREGFQAEAVALASLFGQPESIVEALSTPFPGTTEDDVVIVVLGADFQG